MEAHKATQQMVTIHRVMQPPATVDRAIMRRELTLSNSSHKNIVKNKTCFL